MDNMGGTMQVRISKRAKQHFDKQREHFIEMAYSGQTTSQALAIELYCELTEGRFSKESLHLIALDAAKRERRRVRKDAMPCLLNIWYLLGQHSEKSGSSSEDDRYVPYGTLRRYAAAIQYGLRRELSGEDFKNQLVKHSVTTLAKRYDERRRKRPQYNGKPTKMRQGRRRVKDD